MATGWTDHFERNLAALRTFQPDVADWVDRVPVYDTVRPAIGRDGCPSFVLHGRGQRPSWFGGSSMPSISAPTLFADFRSDGRNLALPGVLTGHEPLVLLRRMPAHAALFVFEPDPLHLKLAMGVCDSAALVLRRYTVSKRVVDIVERMGPTTPVPLTTPEPLNEAQGRG